MSYDIFFYEAFEEEQEELKKLLPTHLSFHLIPETIQEAGHQQPPAPIISIRTQSIIPVSWATSLSGILSRSTGYDHLLQYQKQISQPIPCGYLEEYATRSVAEHAIMLTFTLFRKLKQQFLQFSTFNRDGITGSELLGKNLLVVGVGKIGSEIVRIAQALQMNVKGVDIVQRHSFVDYVTREEGLSWADAVICAMNLTDTNRGYFSYNTLKQARQGVLFINIARGEHAPLEDLYTLLTEHHLGGIGLDVFEDEPTLATVLRQQTSSPQQKKIQLLLQHPNVLLTPHNAFNTHEAVYRKSLFTVQQILYFLEHKKFQWQL